MSGGIPPLPHTCSCCGTEVEGQDTGPVHEEEQRVKVLGGL